MFQILTLVESINTESRDIRSVYLGHIGEMHYVSTLQAEFTVRSYQSSTNNCCVNLAPYENDINNCNRKRKNGVYMKEYGQCKCYVSCALGPVCAEVLSFDTRSNLGIYVLLSLVIFAFISRIRIV